MIKCLITSTLLDKLGFSEYWDENGDWGGRTLTFSDGTRFRIMDLGELDDDEFGYGNGKYRPAHFCFAGWFAIPEIKEKADHELFFLHEMYQCIEKFYPSCLNEFLFRCNALKLTYYIDSFLKHNG